jgi:hypothetical protein
MVIGMATREEVHKLVEELPEADLDSVAENLTARRDPESPRPGDIVDEWGNLSAVRRASAEKVGNFSGVLGHLSRDEIAVHGETLGETITRVEREELAETIARTDREKQQ